MKTARAFLLVLFLLALCGGASVPARAHHTQQANRSVTLTLLSTTDSHGHLLAINELTNRPTNEGLAKIATLVRQIRAHTPNTLLLDCGDTTEGTPFAYYFAVEDTSAPNPEIAAFNAMHYDAMAVGNHEFNFGEQEMWKAKGESHFPWLAANLKEAYSGGVRYIAPYVIKRVAGIRVGIVGFVTPGVPRWEIPAHYAGYTFEPIVESAKRVIPEVRAKSDLVVVIMHSGLDRNPETGKPSYGGVQMPGENAALETAQQVPGIDVLFYGHTHEEMPKLIVNGVLMAQAKNWGGSLARADVTMEREASGKWAVVSKTSTTIRPMADTPQDSEIVKLLEPYQRKVEAYLDTPIAKTDRTLDGALARYQDEPLVDAIQDAQMEFAHADVSLATMFIPSTHVKAGTVTIRDAFGIYPYENTLYAVQMTGAELKDALEHAASFYPSWPPAGGKMRLPGYDADSAKGVSYEIDLLQPVGSRIVNLRFHGKPLSPEQKLRVAINNYRDTGGGGYSVYRDLPVVYRSKREIRDLLIEYLKQTTRFPAADDHWRIVPDEARAAIEKQALAQEQERRAPANLQR